MAHCAKRPRITRRYLDGSLILVTTFETADGAVELIDFMSPRDDGADLVRLIRGVRGRVELRTEFILRFDYGFSVPWIERLEDAGLRAVAGPDMAVLRTPVPLQGRDFTTNGEFTVGAGDTEALLGLGERNHGQGPGRRIERSTVLRTRTPVITP